MQTLDMHGGRKPLTPDQRHDPEQHLQTGYPRRGLRIRGFYSTGVIRERASYGPGCEGLVYPLSSAADTSTEKLPVSRVLDGGTLGNELTKTLKAAPTGGLEA